MTNTRNEGSLPSIIGRPPKHDKPAVISGITCSDTTKERFELYCDKMNMSRGDALEFMLDTLEGNITAHERDWVKKAEQWIYYCPNKKQFVRIKPFQNGEEEIKSVIKCQLCGENVIKKGRIEKDESLKHIDGMPFGAGD